MTITLFRKLRAAALLAVFLGTSVLPPSLALEDEAPAAAPSETNMLSTTQALDASFHVRGSGVHPEILVDIPEPQALEAVLTPPVDDVAVPIAANLPRELVTVEMVPEVIEIDNDLAKDQAKTEVYRWEDVKSEPGKTHIKLGARFPIALLSSHNSKTCRVGDRVEARLKSDLIVADKLVARKHDKVLGRVTSAHKARRLLVAEFSPKRWMRANGAIGLTFDEIVTSEGEHLALAAKPARMSRIIANKAEGRVLGVNAQGEVASPLSIQLKHQGLHLAIRGAASAGGVFSMGAVPVAFGVIGAINPSFAFMHPVGTNVRHRRLKGFGMGIIGGLPGGFLMCDYLIRGAESSLKPGDEFLVAFEQDFTGEASTSATIDPGAKLRVQGEVVPAKKK